MQPEADALKTPAKKEQEDVFAPPAPAENAPTSAERREPESDSPKIGPADGTQRAAQPFAPSPAPENAAGRSVSGAPEEGTVHLVTPASEAVWRTPRAPSGAIRTTTAQAKAPEHAAPRNNGCWQCS